MSTEMVYTPVEAIDGIWLKREDHYRLPNGVNGGKLRACRYLLEGARHAGATRIISAASVLSPQNAMAATIARELGMRCTVIVGGTHPASAIRHPSIRIAVAAGADMEYIGVGYNPALQRAALETYRATPASYWLRYGITPPPDAAHRTIREFHQTTATQTHNLPARVTTLIIPFGSGNTAAGVLWGLAQTPHPALRHVALYGIGPDRRGWLDDRLALLGTSRATLPFALDVVDLHGTGFATYSDTMPGAIGSVVLHPTYEGKVLRHLEQHRPESWTRRDGTTALWIVGGPLPTQRAHPSLPRPLLPSSTSQHEYEVPR